MRRWVNLLMGGGEEMEKVIQEAQAVGRALWHHLKVAAVISYKGRAQC